MGRFRKRIFLGFLALGSLGIGGAKACSWSYEPWEFNYSFFAPEMNENQELMPLHHSFHYFYPETWLDQDIVPYGSLLDDWKRYFPGNIPETDIENLVYNTAWGDYELIEDRIANPAAQLGGDLDGNKAVDYLVANRRNDVVQYLRLAKQAEDYALNRDPWNDDLAAANLASEELTKKANWLIKETKDPFLVERYAFQMVRLEHYLGWNEDCIATYEQYFQTPSLNRIYWWALEHAAGAYLNMGESDKATLLYSKVFANSPDRKLPSFLSSEAFGANDFEGALQVAKGPEEKAQVLALKAFDLDEPSLDEMKAVYEMYPESPLLPILLTREVNKLEMNLLPANFLDGYVEDMGTISFGSGNKEVADLAAFVQKCIQEGIVKEKGLWKIGYAYLQFLNGRYRDAESELSSFLASKAYGSNQELANRANVFLFMARAAGVQNLTAHAEDNLLEELDRLPEISESVRNQSPKAFLMDVLRAKYENQGDAARAYVCHNTMNMLEMSSDPDLGEKILSYLQTPVRSKLDEKLREQFDASENEVIEFIGTCYLRIFDLDAARKWFAQLPEEYSGDNFRLEGDPFESHFSDCVWCGYSNDRDLTKASFLDEFEKLLALKEEGRGDESARAALQLGNAVYNTSYYGFGWQARDYDRSGNGWSYMEHPSEQVSRWDSGENMDQAIALGYYREAYRLATNKELKAEAAFMAGKCLFMEIYAGKETAEKAWLGQFDLLIRDYRKTKTFKRLTEECGTLVRYIEAKKKGREFHAPNMYYW